MLFSSVSSFSQAVFINEIHYDNSGADANEGIEIAGPAGTDLSCYQIILYNGSGGASYSTTTLSGTIDDEGCGFGAQNFLISGIQNGAPDGICLYYDPSLCAGPGIAAVIQFFSYEGTFTATNGPANGMLSTNIGVAEAGGSAVGHSLQLGGVGTTYPSFAWAGSALASPGSINPTQNFCGCTVAAEPASNGGSVVVSAVDCNTFTLTFTGGDGANNLVVMSTSAVAGSPVDQTTYNDNAAFGSGDQVIAGEYVVYNGTATTVNITGLAPSTTYFIAVFDFNGNACEENYYLTTPPTAMQATSTCVCPYMTSALINSCAGVCSEGDNEILFLNSGSYAIPVNSTNINITYGNAPVPTTGYTDVIISDPSSIIADLHTSAGCGGIFIDANAAGTIPANSSFIVIDDDICAATALDFSAFCGGPAIYVVITQDPSWNTSGNFANSNTCSGNARYFRTDFSGIDPGCVTDYDWVCSNVTGTDGDFVNWNSGGGTGSLYGDDDCSVETTVLPIELMRFEATAQGDEVLLEWRTASEQENRMFEVERSRDGSHFSTIGELPGAGTTNYPQNYHLYDHDPSQGVSYYRLKQIDFNGDFSYSAIRAVEIELDAGPHIGYVNTGNGAIDVHYLLDRETHFVVELIDVTGRKVYETSVDGQTEGKFSIPALQLANGIFFIRLSNESGSDIRRFRF
jgi:hypothetical protein